MTKSQLSKALIAACSLFILAGCSSQTPVVLSDNPCPLLPSDPVFVVNSDLATWQNYTDPQYGFSIKIPANYVIELSTAPNKGDYLDYYDIKSSQQYKLGNACTSLNYASIIISKADQSIGRQELSGGTEFRGGTSYYASDQNYAYEIREFTDNATFAKFAKTFTLPAKEVTTTTDYKNFIGAWFTIDYPKDFTVEPGQPTSYPLASDYLASHPDLKYGTVDGASFHSPDGEVIFHIYSPHNNENQGIPLALGPVGEKNVSKKVEVIKSLTYTYLTFKPAGSDVTRSILDITEEGGIDKKTFAFDYKNQAAYNQYLEQYKHFKASLVQFWHD